MWIDRLSDKIIWSIYIYLSRLKTNFQVGLSRSTTGCVAACLFREFQLTASYEGLVETVPGTAICI